MSQNSKMIKEYLDKLVDTGSILQKADAHQQRVSLFCDTCAEHAPQQHVNHELTNRMTREQAVLRVLLHLEEMFELVRGLGVSVRLADHVDVGADIAQLCPLKGDFVATADGTVDLKEIIDGLVDSSVISMGTASLLGIPVQCFTEVVDNNNIDKFGPGHSYNDSGKLIKPAGHPKPDLAKVVETITEGKSLEENFAPYNWSDIN